MIKRIAALILILVPGHFVANSEVEDAEDALGLPPLNIDWQRPNRYGAGTSVPDEHAPGGFAASGNVPQKLPIGMRSEADGVEIWTYPDRPVAVRGENRGFTVWVVNGTDEPLSLLAQDSCIPMVLEVRDDDGAWKAIEYMPPSFCGNSYHHVTARPGEYWRFAAPVFEGSFETQLRFKLIRSLGKAVYSDPFDGSINPEQFDVRGGYHSADAISDVDFIETLEKPHENAAGNDLTAPE